VNKKIQIIFISIIFTLILLELAIRIYAFRIGKGFFENPLSFISSFFTIYDWPAPYKKGDYYIFKKGEMVKKEKKRNTIRIICFGGSTTLNVRNKKGWCYSKLLQERLSKKYPHLVIEVLNAGGDGFSSAHTLVNFSLRCLELKPDIITIYENINDLSANYYGKEILSDYSNKYLTYDFLAYRHRYGFWGSLLRYSYLARFINSRTSFFRNMANIDMDRRRDFKKGEEYFRNNLRSIIAIAKANNIYPILATQGAKKSLRKDKGFSAYNEIIKEVGRKEGVCVVDIAENFLNDDKFFLDEVHLEAEGVKQIANGLFDPIDAYIKMKNK